MKLIRVKDLHTVLQLIEDNFSPLPAEKVSLEQAGGRTVSETVIAREDVPGFNRSTVDGYAVFAGDTFGAGESLPAVLDCTGEVLMGQAAPEIEPGQCCQVHTGGMLPPGADAVVMVENTEVLGSQVHIYRQVAPGENVIHRGEDLQKGSPVLQAGTRLRAPELGLLASLGITEVTVYRRPVVGLLSSGDELVPYHTAKVSPGQIRDSNGIAINYLARQAGAVVINGGILPDDFSQFLSRSQKLLAEVDFLVLSGGSSVGTRDFTAQTMQELGRPGLLVEGIAIQPGKPTLLANCRGKPVLGLPGHPVSALNIFAQFGVAVLNRLSGIPGKLFTPTVRAVLNRNIPSRSGRTDYVRVRLSSVNGHPEASPIFGRSGMLRTLAQADGIVIVPAEKEGLSAGEPVEVILWD